MTTDCQVDLLVIGCGPAGASAARIAAEAGLHVLLVDRRARIGDPVQCAEFVPLPMAPHVKRSGTLVQMIATMTSVLPSGTWDVSDFPGLIIDRGAFDRALADEAVAAGATLWTSCSFASWDGTTACLRRSGSVIAVAARSLIGADGPHSDVAAALGLPPQPVVQTRQYTVPLLHARHSTDIYLSDRFAGGYGWLFPKGDVANLGVGADRAIDPDLKIPLDELHHTLIEQGMIGAEIIGRTGGPIPVGGIRRMIHDDVLLIGDAAGLTHPITGAGISAAVISGEAAGHATARRLHGDAHAYDEFAEEMNELFGPTIERGLNCRARFRPLWRSPATQDDTVMRQGWIAFDQYFQGSAGQDAVGLV